MIIQIMVESQLKNGKWYNVTKKCWRYKTIEDIKIKLPLQFCMNGLTITNSIFSIEFVFFCVIFVR